MNLQTTWTVLRETRNSAAAGILVAALDSSQPAIRRSALAVLLERRDEEVQGEILRRVPRFGAEEMELLAGSGQMMRNALLAALCGTDESLCRYACQMVLSIRSYEPIAAIATTLATGKELGSSPLPVTLVALAASLEQEIANGSPQRNTDELELLRHRALTALEASLTCPSPEAQAAIVEAFLTLAPSEHPTLLTILAGRDHPVHGPVFDVLRSSSADGILRLLVEFIEDTAIPDHVLQLTAGRTDRKFVQRLLGDLRPRPSLRVLANMQRLNHVAWLENPTDLLLPLEGTLQAVAVDLAVASQIDRRMLVHLLMTVLEQGRPEGRQASCRVLRDAAVDQADELLTRALDDADPTVAAIAAEQLQQRRAPNGLSGVVDVLRDVACGRNSATPRPWPRLAENPQIAPDDQSPATWRKAS